MPRPRGGPGVGAGPEFDWARLFPFLRWRGLITVRSTRADLLAGITGAIIVLPQGVAFAIIAGLPPEYGLYSAIVPALVAALFGSSLTAYLPLASMAAVLLVVAAGLVDVRRIRSIAQTSRPEAVVLVVTLATTLVAELEFAIYVGVILSLVLYLNRTAHPHFITLVPDPESKRPRFVNVLKHPAPECPQLKIVRIDGSVFFGAVNHVAEQLDLITRENPEQAHLLVVGDGINFIDVAGCEMFAEEARRLRLEGRSLYLCSLKGEVLAVLERGGCIGRVGGENLFPSKSEAVRTLVLTRLDPERCRVCRARIFDECARMPGAESAGESRSSDSSGRGGKRAPVLQK